MQHSRVNQAREVGVCFCGAESVSRLAEEIENDGRVTCRGRDGSFQGLQHDCPLRPHLYPTRKCNVCVVRFSDGRRRRRRLMFLCCAMCISRGVYLAHLRVVVPVVVVRVWVLAGRHATITTHTGRVFVCCAHLAALCSARYVLPSS